MPVLNPINFAHEVSKKVRNGQLVILKDIAVKTGYSKAVSKSPTKITRTKAYQQEMAKLNRPLIEGLQQQINKFKNEIEIRNLKGEDTRTLVGALDIYIKNYQLLSGGATERQVFVIPSEIMAKNNIEITKQDL